jgi:Na+/H+-dicarboxylate symporter
VSKASHIIILIFSLVICSNFVVTFLAHYVGMWIYNFDLSLPLLDTTSSLDLLWNIEIPQIIDNDKAMLAGIILGVVSAKWLPIWTKNFVLKIDYFVSKTLQMLVGIIPLFIIGFIVKIQYDGIMGIVIKNYAFIFIVIAVIQYSYILLSYFILSDAKISTFIDSIKNTLPAAIVGFSSMSSAAAMPLSIIGAKKMQNIKM